MTWQSEQFETHRTHLQAVAYRILGSSADAEDAVQEAWLRLSGADAGEVENMRGWLTTVVSRICLDVLRARRAHPEELVDSTAHGPIVSLPGGPDPEHEALLADSVGIALLVVLDALTPAERIAFVLHDMFAVPFEEIAPIVERTPAAARQLASRARRRVQGAGTTFDKDGFAAQQRVVDAFITAARSGDFEALLSVLHPDVVFNADRGIAMAPGPRRITGAGSVAATILERGAAFAPYSRDALVNGAPGLVVFFGGKLRSVLGFKVSDGRITGLDLFIDPDTLSQLRL
jgi:RNA polymerase sigma-70 factor (ECF subfamily)